MCFSCYDGSVRTAKYVKKNKKITGNSEMSAQLLRFIMTLDTRSVLVGTQVDTRHKEVKLLPAFSSHHLSESLSTWHVQHFQTDVVPCGRGELNDTDDE